MTATSSPFDPPASTQPTNEKPSYLDYLAEQAQASLKIGQNLNGELKQPKPIKNELPAVWKLVHIDMLNRNEFGYKKYGTYLQPHNGRDALQDAYEEALDLAVYLRQSLYERNGK